MYRKWFVVILMMMTGYSMCYGAIVKPEILSLKKALQRSKEVSVSVLVANARVQKALSQIDVNQSALLPQISASLNGQRQSRDLRMSGISIPAAGNYTGPFNTFDVRAKITQTIFDAGTKERLKSVRLSHKISSIQMQKAQDDALALVAILYIEAKRATQALKAFEIAVVRDRRIYAHNMQEYRQGMKKAIDVQKSKSNLYQSRFQLKSARHAAYEKRLDVMAALQMDTSNDIIFDQEEDLNLLAHNKMIDAVESIEVKVAEGQLELAQDHVNTERADLLPKVSLVGDYGRSGENPERASNTYTLGVMATMPIWQGGSHEAKIKSAQAEAQEAKAILQDVKAQSNIQVLEAAQNVERVKSLIVTQKAQWDLSRSQYRLAQQEYANGIGTVVNVIQAMAEETIKRDQYQESIATLWLAHISLAKAQGQIQKILL